MSDERLKRDAAVQALLEQPWSPEREAACWQLLRPLLRKLFRGRRWGRAAADPDDWADFHTDVVLALRQYDPRRGPWRPYLYKVARNWLARRRPGLPPSVPNELDRNYPTCPPEVGYDDVEAALWLLERLGPAQRALLEAIFGIGRQPVSASEEARRRGLTPQAVSLRVRLLLAALREVVHVRRRR